MVKGITRQVIVVKSPDERLFDQAIFLVRDDALRRPGVSEKDILEEARRAADGYLRRNLHVGAQPHLPAVFYAMLGALAVGTAWILTVVRF